MTYLQRRAPWRRSKYGNKKTKAVAGGKAYDSKGEAKYAAHLGARRLAGEISAWDRQVRIDLKVNGYKVCAYIMDFVVHMPDGSIELHEYKGYATDVWRLKWKILEATLDDVTKRMWPGKEVRMVLVMHR